MYKHQARRHKSPGNFSCMDNQMKGKPKKGGCKSASRRFSSNPNRAQSQGLEQEISNIQTLKTDQKRKKNKE